METRMYIAMVKQDESPAGVRYRAEMDVAGEPYLSRNGKQRHRTATRRAVFEFRFDTQEIVFIPELSDAVFLENVRHQMPCLMKMRHCQREGHFPEKVEWAS
jgi:hypothetical protein